ncbi:PREDICTED: peroxisomal acyl-coenzyme A oxidase 1-like [Priapulus caudatus]|uniref:Acyl-coenzyme A oxidase n=1 Tax=Priapulus caudatus TaxID=37621 RepID=A0ABM1E2Z0_PRICU|nr:PREDICTED: peroxisomal acyl-coenzyme A oxidase 1-like [Priapulus caudatus]
MDMKVNPDLQKERDSRTFDVDELSNVIYENGERRNRRKEIAKYVENTPVLHRDCVPFQTRSEQYEAALRRGLKVFEFADECSWCKDDIVALLQMISSDCCFVLHLGLVIPAFDKLASDEQTAKWLPLCMQLQVIAAYAQTELGHGTYLPKLETTATYDTSTEEFILNSPTLTSMKFWPGGLGHSSTHAIVMAQLWVNGKCHGPHPFFVQLRSLQDHRPLPVVKLGQLSADGVYTRRGSEKSGMRRWSNLVQGAAQIARATAVCAGSARRGGPGEQESQVIDYQTQQMKLFPWIAMTFSFLFLRKHVEEVYNARTEEMNEGNYSNLAELHSVSAGLKALCSEQAWQGCDAVRMACGGHGALTASELPGIADYAKALCTAEGENTVMYLEAGRHLLKQLAAVRAGRRVADSIQYLGQPAYTSDIRASAEFANPAKVLKAFEGRAAAMIRHVALRMERCAAAGARDAMEAYDLSSVLLVDAAKAHSELYLLRAFAAGVATLTVSPHLARIFTALLTLQATYAITRSSGQFLQAGVLTAEQTQWAAEEMLQTFTVIRPNAVALMDAYEHPDVMLNSVLGCYDGNVYTRIFESVQKEPMNKSEVHPAYYKVLQQKLKNTKARL